MKKATDLFLLAAVGLSSFLAVPAAADPVTITKTSNQTTYGPNTIATFTITIGNPSLAGMTIDGINDQLPMGFTYQSLDPSSQVTGANSTSMPFMGAFGSINFTGGIFSGGNMSYYIPAGGTIILRYRAKAPNAPAINLVTMASAYIGNSVIGTGNNTVSVGSTLPRTLLSFNAGWINTNAIKLDWTMISESAGEQFEIEKMNSNGGFQMIGQLNSPGSNGLVQSYAFIDSFPATENNAYRLKMNGGKYSPVVRITRDQPDWNLDKVFPSPFTNELTIQIASTKKQTVTLQLSDRAGNKRVNCSRNCINGSNTFILDNLYLLPPGIYILKVTAGGKSFQEQLVKQ